MFYSIILELQERTTYERALLFSLAASAIIISFAAGLLSAAHGFKAF